MSTDRELLDLAARAAGIKIDLTYTDKYPPTSLPDGYLVIFNSSGGHSFWSPLADDGDALRLAVKLRLIITFTGAAGPHVSAGKRMGPFSSEMLPDRLFELEQDCAATRRAIVRAAAEIGKAL